MSQAVVTFKVMPESPEVDLQALQSYTEDQIQDFFSPDELKVKKEPVAFGLKALVIQFTMDEEEGTTDDLEAAVDEHDDVRSAETTDVRRAFG
jgi:elongation factor 1-beta